MTATPNWKIEKNDLIEGLTELGAIAFEAGKIIEPPEDPESSPEVTL